MWGIGLFFCRLHLPKCPVTMVPEFIGGGGILIATQMLQPLLDGIHSTRDRVNSYFTENENGKINLPFQPCIQPTIVRFIHRRTEQIIMRGNDHPFRRHIKRQVLEVVIRVTNQQAEHKPVEQAFRCLPHSQSEASYCTHNNNRTVIFNADDGGLETFTLRAGALILVAHSA